MSAPEKGQLGNRHFPQQSQPVSNRIDDSDLGTSPFMVAKIFCVLQYIKEEFEDHGRHAL